MRRILGALAIAALAACSSAAHEAPPPRQSLLGSAKKVVLAAEVTRVRLTVSDRALTVRSELVLRNIRFEKHPGTQFHVIAERRDDRTRRARIGTLSFYTPATAPVTTSRTFDATDALRTIAASRADLANIDLVFEATTGRGDANGEAPFNPRTRVTIEAVELREKE